MAKILVVDDDIDFLLQQKIKLEAEGFEVVTAESQAEGEKLLGEVKPDMVILDLMMEHMDGGFILCHNIKKQNPSLPVIMVTGVTSDTGMDFAAIDGAGRNWVKADAILAKPIRFEELKREINRLLETGG